MKITPDMYYEINFKPDVWWEESANKPSCAMLPGNVIDLTEFCLSIQRHRNCTIAYSRAEVENVEFMNRACDQ